MNESMEVDSQDINAGSADSSQNPSSSSQQSQQEGRDQSTPQSSHPAVHERGEREEEPCQQGQAAEEEAEEAKEAEEVKEEAEKKAEGEGGLVKQVVNGEENIPRASRLREGEKDSLVELCVKKESVYVDPHTVMRRFWVEMSEALSKDIGRPFRSCEGVMKRLTDDRIKVRPQTESGRNREVRNDRTVELDKWIDIMELRVSNLAVEAAARQRTLREPEFGVRAAEAARNAMVDDSEGENSEDSEVNIDPALRSAVQPSSQEARVQTLQMTVASREQNPEEVRVRVSSEARTPQEQRNTEEPNRSQQSGRQATGISAQREAAAREAATTEVVERRSNANGLGRGLASQITHTFEAMTTQNSVLSAAIVANTEAANNQAAPAANTQASRVDSERLVRLEECAERLEERQAEAAEEQRQAAAEQRQVSEKILALLQNQLR
ncbi:MAG: hypothetical protein M1835_001860 [Candelina submexicana]|nr:MAG: hypothetical protein M1835_001860 [Candelina submexicana]